MTASAYSLLWQFLLIDTTALFISEVRSFLRATYESDTCTVLSMLKEGIPIDVSNTVMLLYSCCIGQS